MKPKSYPDAQFVLLLAFAVLNFIALILMWAFVRETAGTVINAKEGKINSMSLEELNYIFGVRTTRHIRYHLTEMLPWHLRMIRWVLFRCFTNRFKRPDDPERVWQWELANDTNSSDNESTESKGGTASHAEMAAVNSPSPPMMSRASLPAHSQSRPEPRQRVSSSPSLRRQRRYF